LARLLLAHKADVNIRASDGGTPLHWAAERGNRAMVELLLTSGADVSAKNNKGQTPLDVVEGVSRPSAAPPVRALPPPGASSANEVKELLQKASEKKPPAP
jgi:hypothetical protein